MKLEEITEAVASTSLAHDDATPPPAAPQDAEADADDALMDAFAKSPAMAELKDKSGAEILASLNSSPLFMTSLEENDDLAALQALAYEGTPLEVATSFKERGNEAFSARLHADAKEFYAKAINVLLLEIRSRQRGEKVDEAEEVKAQISVLEACLLNRAACHLELKNYRSCIQDCASAIRINAKNVKAYYRSSRALLALHKIAEADDSCARGLALDPANKSLLLIADQIIKANAKLEAQRKIVQQREDRRILEAKTLRAALKARNITLRTTAQPPEMEDARIELVPDPVDPASALVFPAVLLYPLDLESDFIKAWGETDSVSHHLDYILPLPWDTKHEYVKGKVVCYMETASGGLLKLGGKITLLEVLGRDGVEVVDGVVRVFVLPKTKATAWVEEFKRKKGLEL